MTKRIILTALLVCLVFGTAMAQRARDHIAQGREHMQAQRFEEAITSFQAALQLEPRNKEVPSLLLQAQERRVEQLYNNAQALQRQGNLAEAVEQYNLALKTAPSGYNTRAIERSRQEAQTALDRHNLTTRRITEPLTDNDFEYIQNRQGKITITRYLEKGRVGIRDIIVPAQIQGIDVTEIGESAFARGSYQVSDFRFTFIPRGGEVFESVTIPPTITIIGQFAFLGREIKTLNLHDNITTIGSGAFAENKIAAVALPANLRTINAIAFCNNQITTVIIPSGVTAIGSAAFARNSLTEITIPDNVTRINAGAFARNRINKITFSNSGKLTTLENTAFANNQMTSLVLPEGLTEIITDGGKELGDMYRLSSLAEVNREGGAFDSNPLVYLKIPSTIRRGGRIANRVPIVEWEKPIAGMVFLGNAEVLKIGADVNLNIETSFNNFYNSQGKKAGIYIKRGTIWSLGTQEDFDAILAERTK